jgi:predicted DNA-binding transcriptional regulator YafY
LPFQEADVESTSLSPQNAEKLTFECGSWANGPDHLLSREQQEDLREKLLAANPAELKVKIEHDADLSSEPAPIAAARSAEEKLRAYWAMKGSPTADRQDRLLAKLAEVENSVLSSRGN